jgi:hypothetical protein
VDKWVIDGDDVELDGTALCIRQGEVRAETGGLSWDDYVLRAKFLITPTGKNPKYCVQLTADGTGVYCQLVPHCMLIAYHEEKTQNIVCHELTHAFTSRMFEAIS